MNIVKIVTIILFFTSTVSKSAIVNPKISEKYFDIFSKSILVEEDIERYQKIFQYQENCKWKLAHKYILTNNLVNNEHNLMC